MSDALAETHETERDQLETGAQRPSSSSDVEPAATKGETLYAGLKDGALALFFVFFVVVALGLRSSGPDGAEVASPVPSSGIIEVTLRDFTIDGDLIAPPGPVVFEIVNIGSVDHNVVGRSIDVQTPDIAPVGTATLSLGELEPGEYEFFCDISGHEESGMVATLVVTEPPAPVDEVDESDQGASG